MRVMHYLIMKKWLGHEISPFLDPGLSNNFKEVVPHNSIDDGLIIRIMDYPYPQTSCLRAFQVLGLFIIANSISLFKVGLVISRFTRKINHVTCLLFLEAFP